MSGLATTFDLLANTDNEAAAAVLAAALDAAQREVRDLALTALLARRNAAAELNILRRWPNLSQRWKQQIAERPGWLSDAIRTGVSNRDRQMYEAACSAAVFTRDYDSLPVLATAASDATNPLGSFAAAATLELCELLAEEIVAPRDYRIRRDPQLQRNHLMGSLEHAASQFPVHGRRELLEAFLLLANRENAVLKRLLQSPSDRCFPPITEILATSPRPCIERLLLTYLDDPHAPLSAMQIIGRRCDVSFLRHVTRKIGAEPNNTIKANVRRIESLAWAAANVSVLDALREPEQPGVVHLAVLSATPRKHALAAVSYVLRHGKAVARRIAAAALAEFGGPEANELAVRALDDDDALVRAAVARQLRDRNVPGAIQRLVGLLGSTHVAEREAAQAGLVEFTFDHFAAQFDSLSPEACLSTGAIVRQVDPAATDRIKAELDAPTHGRKKRALELALALDAVSSLQNEIATIVKDEDQYLRIDAIRTLATIDNPLSRQKLRDALLDSEPLVQKAAEAALAELTRRDTVSLAATGRDTVRLTATGGVLPAAPAAGAVPSPVMHTSAAEVAP